MTRMHFPEAVRLWSTRGDEMAAGLRHASEVMSAVAASSGADSTIRTAAAAVESAYALLTSSVYAGRPVKHRAATEHERRLHGATHVLWLREEGR
jgi:hypothetical protein